MYTARLQALVWFEQRAGLPCIAEPVLTGAQDRDQNMRRYRKSGVLALFRS